VSVRYGIVADPRTRLPARRASRTGQGDQRFVARWLRLCQSSPMTDDTVATITKGYTFSEETIELGS
jgi:hypothetical protein